MIKDKQFVHFSFDDLILNLNVRGVHEVRINDNPYELFLDINDDNGEYIVIGFTGAVNRKGTIPPYFSFRGIAKSLNIGLIAISDPSLRLGNDLSLGWYLGNSINNNLSLDIANFLDDLIAFTNKKLILCGGSGGGFAALNIQSLMKNKNRVQSLVWNPQTDITQYGDYWLFKYLKICFGYEAKTLSQAKDFLREKQLPYIVNENLELMSLILINGYDPNHIRKQVRRFLDLEGKSQSYVYFDDWGNGHKPPTKELIIDILLSFINGKSPLDIGSVLEQKKVSKPVLLFKINGQELDKVLDVRISTLVNDPDRLSFIIKSNIYDFFMGYNIRYLVLTSDRKLFESRYLLGSDIAEILIEIKKGGKKINTRHLYIQLIVEDIIGAIKVFQYEFNKINNSLRPSSFNY